MTRQDLEESPFQLTLYISGESATSELAIANLKKIEKAFDAPLDIQVIDMDTSREIALKNGVTVSPTLVRTHPEPIQRLIGDLSNIEEVIACLRKDLHKEEK